MDGTFNGNNGAYRYNEAAAFYREQQEQRRVMDRISRTELHLMCRLVGKTFASEQKLHEYIVALATRLGYLMDDELAHVLRTASHNLWSDTPRFRAVEAA